MPSISITSLTQGNLTERWLFLDTSVAANRLGASPVLIIPAKLGSKRVVQNLGATDIVLGGPAVAASGGQPFKGQGVLLKGGQTPPDTWTDAVGDGAYYAVTADGSSGYADFIAGLLTSSPVEAGGSYTN
jgi:hypothetical protein